MLNKLIVSATIFLVFGVAQAQPSKTVAEEKKTVKSVIEAFLKKRKQESEDPTTLTSNDPNAPRAASAPPAPPAPPPTIGDRLRDLVAAAACPLPASLIAELKSTDPKGFIPKDMVEALDKGIQGGVLARVANELDDKGVQDIILTVQLAAPKPTTSPGPSPTPSPVAPSENNPSLRKTLEGTAVTLISADSYSRINPGVLMNPTKDHAMYAMDCTGYLTAAMSVSVKAPSADFNSNARGAIDKKKSMYVARAVVFVPAAMALEGSVAPRLNGFLMTNQMRLDILYSVIAEIGQSTTVPVEESRLVTALRYADLLWASNSGSSNLTGEAKLSGGTQVGVGIASIEATGTSGGSASKRVEYSNFQTYWLGAESGNQTVTTSYGALKTRLKDLVKRAAISDEQLIQRNGKLVASVTFNDFNSKICDSPWSVKPSGTDTEPAFSVTSQFVTVDSVGKCVMVLQPAAGPYPVTGATITLEAALPAPAWPTTPTGAAPPKTESAPDIGVLSVKVTLPKNGV